MLWLYDFESPDRRKYLISCEVARYSMLQITRIWKWFYSVAHNTVFFYLKDRSSLLILSIIYFYVLWVFCLHVCARSPGTGVKDNRQLWSVLWVLGIEPSPLEEQPENLNSWAASPAPPHILWNGLVLALWLKPSYRALAASHLLFCWFLCSWLALDTVAGPCELFHFCFLPLLLLALCLAFKTFWVVCFFF